MATCFSSPKDLGALRESTAFFAVEQIARLAHFLNYDSYEGGKSGAKFGQTRSVRAVCRAFGSVSHRLLFYQLPVPTALLVLTTPYHFVPHLSRKLLIVKRKLKG